MRNASVRDQTIGFNRHVLCLQDKAVQWLNSMRLGDGGFVSTVDTIVALRALVTYSYHSRFEFVVQILYYLVVQEPISTKHLLFIMYN